MLLRRAHATILHEGYLWRIAIPYISLSEVVRGPWGIHDDPRHMFMVEDSDGVQYVDDDLTGDEMDMLSGIYLTFTGVHDQMAKLSWFPLACLFDGSGENLGHWTEHNEVLYQRQRKSILDPNVNNNLRVPMNITQWRDKLQGFVYSQRAAKRIEKWSKELLDKVTGRF